MATVSAVAHRRRSVVDSPVRRRVNRSFTDAELNSFLVDDSAASAIQRVYRLVDYKTAI